MIRFYKRSWVVFRYTVKQPEAYISEVLLSLYCRILAH
jgi:hypothetical protein